MEPTNHRTDMNRGALIGRLLEILQWLHEHRASFRTTDLAQDLGIARRTALVWLKSLEASGFVSCERKGHWSWTWKTEHSSFQTWILTKAPPRTPPLVQRALH